MARSDYVKKHVALAWVTYSLIGLVVLFEGPIRSPYAQKDLPPAISLDFQCPTYPVSAGHRLTLFADILGTENVEVVKPLLFRWSTSKGKIESGQGTRKISIVGLDALITKSNEVLVKVVVEGGPPELGNEMSCVMRVDPLCALAPMIDQYGPNSNNETQHLDRFAERLKTGPAESIGYVVSYAGKNACIYEGDWRVTRARDYLVEKHQIPAKRIVTVDGGFRDEWTVELFIQPNGACGPIPAPTRKRVQVHVSGRCG